MAKNDRETLLWILGGLGLAALLFRKREAIMLYGAKALEAGKEWIFEASISNEAKPYSALILQVARETGVDPFLLYALGQRESRWGEALSPSGPGGKGDFGHGHGIMQIDDRSFAEWLASHDWRDPYVNVSKGAEVLKGKLAELGSRANLGSLAPGNGFITIGPQGAAKYGVAQGAYPDPRPLTRDVLIRASIAAYNAGSYNVIREIAMRGPDTIDQVTSGDDYSFDVLAKMTAAAGEFQSRSA